MRVYALIQEDVFEDIAAAVPKAIDEFVTVERRDVIYEEREELDEDGNPTGIITTVDVGLGDPYEVEEQVIQGGYVKIGKFEDFLYILFSGNNATFVQEENVYGDDFVTLMKWADLESFLDRANTNVPVNILNKINAWRVSKSLEEFQLGVNNLEVLEDAADLVKSKIMITQFSIARSND